MAASLALATTLIRRLAFFTALTGRFSPLALAHLALAAAAMFALPAALTLRFLLGTSPFPDLAGVPNTRLSSFASDSILSWIVAARRSCCAVRFTSDGFMRHIVNPLARCQVSEAKRGKDLSSPRKCGLWQALSALEKMKQIAQGRLQNKAPNSRTITIKRKVNSGAAALIMVISGVTRWG